MKNENPHKVDDDLIIRYVTGNTTGSEVKLVEKWLQENSENQKRLDRFQKIWKHSRSIEFLGAIRTDQAWSKVRSRIDFKGKQPMEGERPKELSLLYQFVKIAAVFIIMVVTVYFLNQFYKQRFSEELLACSAIEETKDLVLSDGTVVYLNRGSTIHYPEKFKRNERVVVLSGEAFFEVSENQRKPFIVTIGEDLALKVLGTSFNINASGMDAPVIVHVISGKVILYKRNHEDSGIVLVKDEQGSYSNNNLIKSTTDDANFLSWKTGILAFSNTPVDEVVIQLSRHYRQPVRVTGSWAGSTRLTSTFEDQSLDDVLDEIQLVLKIQYRYQNDTILIYK